MSVKRMVFVLSVFIGLSSFSSWGQFEPANKIHVVLTPSASLLAERQEFSFDYEVESKTDSRQFVQDFVLTVPALTGVKQILSPPNTQWTHIKIHNYTDLKTQLIDWFPERGPSSEPNIFRLPANDTIRPGQKLSGFKVLGRNLPGIRFFWIEGFVRPPSMDEIIDYMNAKHNQHYRHFDAIPLEYLHEIPYFQPLHLNAVSGKVVGPDILPNKLTHEQLLDRMVQLTQEAFTLGWVNDQVIANNLGEKLKGVKEKVQAGQAAVAANILHAFIHDLEAQHREGEEVTQANNDKHINDSAFYLLKPNAEFILWKLGAK